MTGRQSARVRPRARARVERCGNARRRDRVQCAPARPNCSRRRRAERASRYRALWLLAGLYLVPSVAAAQPDDAERAFVEGVEAFRRGDLVAAIDAFERSLAVRAGPAAAFNLASVLSEANEPRRAFLLVEALRSGEYGPIAADRQAAIDELEERLRAELVRARIRIRGPAEATVVLDEEEGVLVRGELTTYLERGSHVVRASAAGHGEVSDTFRAVFGAESSIVLELRPAAAAQAGARRRAPRPIASATAGGEEDAGSLAWLWIGGAIAVGAGALVALLLLVDPFAQGPREDDTWGRTLTLRF